MFSSFCEPRLPQRTRPVQQGAVDTPEGDRGQPRTVPKTGLSSLKTTVPFGDLPEDGGRATDHRPLTVTFPDPPPRRKTCPLVLATSILPEPLMFASIGP